MIVVVSAEPTKVMCECFFVPHGVIDEIIQCGYASLTSVYTRHEEVLEGAVFGEAARIVEGGCTPGFDFLTQLTVSDYSIWFTKVLRQLVGR